MYFSHKGLYGDDGKQNENYYRIGDIGIIQRQCNKKWKLLGFRVQSSKGFRLQSLGLGLLGGKVITDLHAKLHRSSEKRVCNWNGTHWPLQ